jgi:chromosomal replication initiator protein
MNELNKNIIWNDCLESIKVSLSPANFSTWFSQTHLTNLEKIEKRHLAEIGCPSSFIKTTIETRYYGLIQDSLSKSLNTPCDLTFIVKEKVISKKLKDETLAPLFNQNNAADDRKQLQVKISRAGLRPNFTFDNFAVSSSNQMAWAAAEAVSKNPGSAYNPLFLWGGVGVGKTHLMSSIGLSILRNDSNSESKVILCTGEDFTNDIVEGIRKKTTEKFRNRFRYVDVLLIDDIQFIAGKDAVQEEFFHTFNALVSSGSQIILTSDRPPSDISKLEERLKSRFEAGLIIDISPPDFELRCAIIQIKAKERGLDIPMDIVQLIASNIESARKIEGFLVRLSSEAKLNNINTINEEVVTSILGKGISDTNEKSKSIAPNEVVDAVSDHYSIGKRALFGKSRTQLIARPRQVLMYMLRTQLQLPLQEIGRMIGGRDHTTVMHAVNKITTLASENVQIREDIQGIKNKL